MSELVDFFGAPLRDSVAFYVVAADGKAVLELFFATEQVFADHALEDARHGAGFLAVRCPTDHLKNSALSVIELEALLDARYYSRLGMEHLGGDSRPTKGTRHEMPDVSSDDPN